MIQIVEATKKENPFDQRFLSVPVQEDNTLNSVLSTKIAFAIKQVLRQYPVVPRPYRMCRSGTFGWVLRGRRDLFIFWRFHASPVGFEARGGFGSDRCYNTVCGYQGRQNTDDPIFWYATHLTQGFRKSSQGRVEGAGSVGGHHTARAERVGLLGYVRQESGDTEYPHQESPFKASEWNA